MSEKTLAELVATSVEQYSKELMTLEHSDERITKMLEYMQLQLSHGELHPLSRFWKMRKFCLDNFKEAIPVSKRLRLWEKYRLMIEEVMKLKQIIDEKSVFEKEQIESALNAIQSSIENIDKLIASEAEIPIPKCHCLQKNQLFYNETQKALNVYSSYAKQLNALKKEILGLDISFKKKQEILDHIHSLADKVFPVKRELLTNVSKRYTEDIQFFVKTNFSTSDFKSPTFNLKDQIKQLQSFAKVISLNVDAFSKTRLQLSKCWDKLKNFESEQKKLKDEKKQLSDQKFNEIKKKLGDLKEKKGTLEKEVLNSEIKAIDQLIHQEDLLKFQQKQLKDELNLLDENAAAKPKVSQEVSAFSHIKSEIGKINDNIKYWDFPTLDSQFKALLSLLLELKLSDSHQVKIQRELFALKEALFAKLLEEIKNRIDIEEISTQIESFKKILKQDMQDYRKVLNSSNQSIEKAIVYNELMMQTKSLLSSLEKELAGCKVQA